MAETIEDLEKETENIERITRERVIHEFSPRLKFLAVRLASRVPFQIDFSDLIQAGAIGLMDAMEKFDPNKGAQFKTYAEFRIRGAMLDEVREMDWVPRSVRDKVKKLQKIYKDLEKKYGRPVTEEEVASALDMDLNRFWEFLQQVKKASFINVEALGFNRETEGEVKELAVDAQNKNPLSHLLSGDDRKLLVKGLDQLPEKEKTIISLYYYDELTMKEIGAILKITESRVSQLHTQALFRMKGKLEGWRKGGF